jgi:hypothetical protein
MNLFYYRFLTESSFCLVLEIDKDILKNFVLGGQFQGYFESLVQYTSSEEGATTLEFIQERKVQSAGSRVP